MSSEIEVPETPNWLQELEAKREKRVKARLGHETGAGAPCLKCGDECPGLDLHFWRKCCKICKCSKEEHEVQDDDIYGWAQFQLLGNKPNKIKRKIVLPGKKDEVELDWAPKGHKETVDKYLKTLPPEQLPVKGSQAAQDRKQLLHKQIPIHDIDPTLCHELTNEELNQMNNYISQVKQTSVGVGQLVSLSSIIKGNLHTINPSEAAIIASRYAKGVPLSEIVKLQSQDKATLLRQQGLSQKMSGLHIGDSPSRNLPSFKPNVVNATEQHVNPMVTNIIHDVNYPGYTRDTNQMLLNAQFASGLKPGQYKDNQMGHNDSIDPTIDKKYLQNPHFDPKKVPSQFISQNMPYGQQHSQNVPYNENIAGYKTGDGNSAFVPYNKISSGLRPGEAVDETHPGGANYASRFPNYAKSLDQKLPNTFDNQSSYKSNSAIHNARPNSQDPYAEDVQEMKMNAQGLPSYAPGKLNVHSEVQAPTKIPKNFRDLAFSTYDPTNIDPKVLQDRISDPTYQHDNTTGADAPYEGYPSGGNTVAAGQKYNPSDKESGMSQPNQQNLPVSTMGPSVNYENYPTGFRPGGKQFGHAAPYVGDNAKEFRPGDTGLDGNRYPGGTNVQFDNRNALYTPNEGYPSEYPADNSRGGDTYNQVASGSTVYDPNAPASQYDPSNLAYENYPAISGQNYPTGFRPGSSVGKQFSHTGPYEGDDAKGFIPGGPGADGNRYPGGTDAQFNNKNALYSPKEGYPSGYPADNSGGGDTYNQNPPYDRNVPAGQYGPPNLAYENYPVGFSPDTTVSRQNYPGKQFPDTAPHSGNPKKLSELHPGHINVNEDFLQPSHVTIGAIQDINYPEIKAATQGTNDFYEDYSPDSLREILNNIKLPDCHYCKKPFEENEFAITIDRANVLFHAECFKCAGCNQILADNVYFYNKETDNIYCGRDYAKIRGFPRCKACDELIFTKEYCLAENSTFHLKHFCCIECDKPLAGQDYTLEDEMPYCLPCFEQSKANKCSACARMIKPDEVGCNLNGVHFHAVDECFACKVCKKPLMGKKLLLRNQKLYCSHDCFGADK